MHKVLKDAAQSSDTTSRFFGLWLRLWMVERKQNENDLPYIVLTGKKSALDTF